MNRDAIKQGLEQIWREMNQFIIVDGNDDNADIWDMFGEWHTCEEREYVVRCAVWGYLWGDNIEPGDMDDWDGKRFAGMWMEFVMDIADLLEMDQTWDTMVDCIDENAYEG